MHPGGGQLPMALISPPGTAQAQTCTRREKGALLGWSRVRVFSLSGEAPWVPPPFFRAWLSGVLGPLPLFFGLGFAPRDLAPGSSGS